MSIQSCGFGLYWSPFCQIGKKGKENRIYTHAVHLELVNDNSTQSFLQAFRFVGRRSKPLLIISNNATSFVTASKILVNIFKHSVVEDHLVNERIEWKLLQELHGLVVFMRG